MVSLPLLSLPFFTLWFPGIKRPCPRGRYGSTYGLSTSLCSGACEQGYYCPEGSPTAKQIPCGGVNVFCPRGSARPQYVNPGYYTSKIFLYLIVIFIMFWFVFCSWEWGSKNPHSWEALWTRLLLSKWHQATLFSRILWKYIWFTGFELHWCMFARILLPWRIYLC